MSGFEHAGSGVMEFGGKDEKEILEKILEWVNEEIGARSICPTIFSISFTGGEEKEEEMAAYVAYE